MIVVFDLGGPLLAHGLLRSAGMSPVAAPARAPPLTGPYTLIRCLAR